MNNPTPDAPAPPPGEVEKIAELLMEAEIRHRGRPILEEARWLLAHGLTVARDAPSAGAAIAHQEPWTCGFCGKAGEPSDGSLLICISHLEERDACPVREAAERFLDDLKMIAFHGEPDAHRWASQPEQRLREALAVPCLGTPAAPSETGMEAARKAFNVARDDWLRASGTSARDTVLLEPLRAAIVAYLAAARQADPKGGAWARWSG